ncbi:hypothetical protein J6590_055392 [Homalodisca vitripennis]|nr:hypothetical protein J6590_055392 [Homalodisca vitripennis]
MLQHIRMKVIAIDFLIETSYGPSAGGCSQMYLFKRITFNKPQREANNENAIKKCTATCTTSATLDATRFTNARCVPDYVHDGSFKRSRVPEGVHVVVNM